MARLKREELEKIVDEQLPDHRLSSTTEPADSTAGKFVKPQASTPPIDDVLNRIDFGEESHALAMTADQEEKLDDSIELVEPKNPADPLSRQTRPKAQVISGKKKKVIGSQG